MSEQKHTPLPYYIQDYINSAKGTSWAVFTKYGNDCIARDLTKENAEFIVRACNEYYPLKARIAELEAKYES